MTVTRSQLRDLCRRRLGDLVAPYKFSDLQINQWIVDALAEISITLPRKISLAIDCTAAIHEYDLPGDFRAMLSVEYPQGQDPPEYLARRPVNSPGFWLDDGYYDVIRSDDQAAGSQLILSASPADGQDIAAWYLAAHDYLDADDDVCTLQDHHLELIVLYVRWAAYQELASVESADPDPTNLAMGTLELNAYRAERAYRASLEKAVKADAESGVVCWRME